MRRMITILSIYTAIIFIVCVGVSWAYRPMATVNTGDESLFRFFRALRVFLDMLPAIFLSGFSVACAVLWQQDTANSRQRFSSAMFARYRMVLLESLVLVLLLTLNHEVFIPLAARTLTAIGNGPSELADAKETARSLLEAGEPELAYPYARRATLIARKDEDAAALLVQVQNAIDLAHDRYVHGAAPATIEEQEKPLYTADHSYTVHELLELSRTAAEAQDWFDAHYWATLAVQGCGETDPNFSTASQAAAQAWTRLQNPAGFGNEAELEYYHKKLAAYRAFAAGNTSDNLRAYYLFEELSRYPGKTSADPDVARFLALAQEAVENDYFFIDETENMDELENSHDIYFLLADPRDGTRSVYYIEGAMDTREDGRLVRYLDGLHVVTYTAEGRFVRAMHAPVAKAIAYPVSAMGMEAQELMRADASWKNLPFIMLQAVDRHTRGRIISPWFSYTETGLPDAVREKLGLTDMGGAGAAPYRVTDMAGGAGAATGRSTSRTIFLPMPYGDFVAIKDASAGPDKMDLFSLRSFLGKVTRYGFSYEVFNQNLVTRGMLPLFLLVLFVFAAVLGWNYRIEQDGRTRFKFHWLFLVPVYGSVMYLLQKVATFLYDVANYVLVGMFGGGALAAAFVLYVIALAAMSVCFLARKE